MDQRNDITTKLPHSHSRTDARRTKRSLHTLSALGVVIILASVLLSACDPGDPGVHNAAQQNKAKLDRALQTARTTYFVPDSLLTVNKQGAAWDRPPIPARLRKLRKGNLACF